MKRRRLLETLGAGALSTVGTSQTQLPNIVMIYVDDLGYGDIGCYGSKIKTPNLDKMAHEGAMFRHFYSASPVCSPSRAALLTARYGVRCGVPNVLMPTDTFGLAENETTLANVLKSAGYSTMCVGKWHLGSLPRYLPTNRGFDEYYGIPYSNDQTPSILMHNLTVIESPVQLETLTSRYTDQAIAFIRRSKGSPFFLYMPHTFPHIPLAASQAFKGKSSMGLYGDVIEELDWSVGQVLLELAANGLDSSTLVMFSSDNGPWFQGSAGRLRGRKGDTFEGGMREPFLARFPGRIPPGQVVRGFASTLDILPTVAGLAQAALPPGPLDGVDIWPMLTGETNDVSRPMFLYFDNWDLQCVRLGRWKLHVARHNAPAYTPEPKVGLMNLRLVYPELYDMETDSTESADVSDDNPGIVADMVARVHAVLPSLPQQVQKAWADTLRRPVTPNTSGAWPTP